MIEVVGRERAPHAERRSVRGPRRAAEPVAPRAAEPRRAAATGRAAGAMINFMLLVSRQGKTRLTKWYESYSTKEKARIVREVTARTGAGGPRAKRAAPRAPRAKRPAAGAPPPARQATVLARAPKMCNFIEWRADKKIVYKRYASLFFICCGDRRRERAPRRRSRATRDGRARVARAPSDGRSSSHRRRRSDDGRGRRPRSLRTPRARAGVDSEDNELITLEMIHLFVEVLDRYFGNVCELDIIFNFHKAYYILDELFIAGELEESSKKEVLSICAQMDEMMDESKEEGNGKGGRK